MISSDEILNQEIFSMNQEVLSCVRGILKNKDRGVHSTIFLAIAGGSSTGKTTQISEKLKSFLIGSGYQAEILALDTFQFGDEYLSNNWGKEETKKYRYDHPNNTGLTECLKVLNRLKSGEKEVFVPDFRFLSSKRVGEKVFKNTEIVILEGIYAFYQPLDSFDFAYKIYVQMPLYARLIRRYFRTINQYQIIKPNSCLYEMLSSVRFSHNDFLKKQSKIADSVQNLSFDFGSTIQKFGLQPKDIESDYELTFETALEDSLNSSSCPQHNKNQFLDYKFDSSSVYNLKINLAEIVSGEIVWSFQESDLSIQIYKYGEHFFWVLSYQNKIWEVSAISRETYKLFEKADMLEV